METEIRRMPLPQTTPSTRGRTIYGYAAKFNVLSNNLGGRKPWYELILPNAFPDLNDQDVRATFNHDKNKILARSKKGKGTLKLSIDKIGLRYEFEAPDTSLGRDTLESIRRGDIDGASFAFKVEEDHWTEHNGKRIRQIKRIASLHDVSIVTEGAYSSATAASRSMGSPDPRDEVRDWAARFGI